VIPGVAIEQIDGDDAPGDLDRLDKAPPGPGVGGYRLFSQHMEVARKRLADQIGPSIGEREKAGLMFNDLVKNGKVSAPIVIGRDHLDCGSVASPNRETEAMRDGSDAVSDWPLLNAMINTANGASWVSFHHGGGVGMGYSQHAGMVIVADGTDAAAKRLSRVLTSDPMMGILRHVDASYPEAIAAAKRNGIDVPMPPK